MSYKYLFGIISFRTLNIEHKSNTKIFFSNENYKLLILAKSKFNSGPSFLFSLLTIKFVMGQTKKNSNRNKFMCYPEYAQDKINCNV